MHIMRWLLSHPLIALWILTVIAILLNWTPNTTHDTHASSEVHLDSGVQQPVVQSQAEDTQVMQAPETLVLSVAQLDLLRQARNAYWNNELAQALSVYTDLIEQVPAAVDYKRELANVYWKLGRQQEASTIYAEIALPLWQQGQRDQVMQILPAIDRYYPQKAAEVRSQIKQ